MKMKINGVESTTFTRYPYEHLWDGETKKICFDVEYQIIVSVRGYSSDGTDDQQFVKIKGTRAQTEELECKADFSAGSTATCSVSSAQDIGEYRCVIWRTGGDDGWALTQVMF